MGKLCKQCGSPIYGKARKYCEKCKRSVHLEQMHQYYVDNTVFYQYNGKYWNNRKGIQLCGTAGLGEHAIIDNWEKEYLQIQKEMRNLKLRQKKEFWK